MSTWCRWSFLRAWCPNNDTSFHNTITRVFPKEVSAAVSDRLSIDVFLLPLERDDAANVLFQAAPSDPQTYFALIISDGAFEFLVVEGRGVFSSVRGNSAVQNELTNVRVTVTRDAIEMRSGDQVQQAANTRPDVLKKIIGGQLVMGLSDRAPIDPLLPQEGFEGQILNLRVNGKTVDLGYPVISAKNVTDGRARDTVCQPIACNQHGVCLKNGSCECNVGYRPETLCAALTNDDVCTTVAENECLNGGQCVQDGDWFTCECPPSHKGDRCELLGMSSSVYLKDAFLALPFTAAYVPKQQDREKMSSASSSISRKVAR